MLLETYGMLHFRSLGQENAKRRERKSLGVGFFPFFQQISVAFQNNLWSRWKLTTKRERWWSMKINWNFCWNERECSVQFSQKSFAHRQTQEKYLLSFLNLQKTEFGALKMRDFMHNFGYFATFPLSSQVFASLLLLLLLLLLRSRSHKIFVRLDKRE
jgi:hypothetical protein